MKKSTAFLPKKNREDLKYLVSTILEKIPVCEMIILFGSYARGTYVEYDERVEFGIPTSFKSDYDILVINRSWNYNKMDDKLANVRNLYGKRGHYYYRVPLQLIHESAKKFAKDLEDGRYFFTEIKRDGILLYDSGNLKLPRRRKLKYPEIKAQAKEYFEDKYTRAQKFYKYAKIAYNDSENNMCAFFLHQACENFFITISLVFTLDSKKEHNLQELFKATRGYAPELYTVFPPDDKEEERLFKILVRAYVEGRYNPKFEVSREDLEILMAKVKMFGEITKEVCEKRIQEYDTMVAKK